MRINRRNLLGLLMSLPFVRSAPKAFSYVGRKLIIGGRSRTIVDYNQDTTTIGVTWMKPPGEKDTFRGPVGDPRKG